MVIKVCKPKTFYCIERLFDTVEQFEEAMNSTYNILGWRLLSITERRHWFRKNYYVAVLCQGGVTK